MTKTITLTATTPDVADAELLLNHEDQPMTSSRLVAQRFGKRHSDVLRTITALIPDLDEISRRNFALADYKDAQGKTRSEYRLTKDGFLLLAMSFTGKAATAWKVRFIAAFNARAVALAEAHKRLAWEQARRLEQAEFHDMQHALQQARQAFGKETRAHHFSNEARLVGFAVTGHHAGLDRDTLDTEQLRLLRVIQARNAALIREGVAYEARKEQLRGLGSLLT